MAEKQEDKSDLSLPSSVKFTVGGRNVNALRVPLRSRLKLLKFYSKLFAQIAGGVQGLDDKNQPIIPWDALFARLPDLLETLVDEYSEIIRECTDLDPKWADDNLELNDLWTILQKVAEANKIQEAFETAQEATGVKKKEASETPSGSSG